MQRVLAVGLLSAFLLPACSNEAPPQNTANTVDAGGEGEGEGVGTCAEGQFCANLKAIDPAIVTFTVYNMETKPIRVRYVRPDPSGTEVPLGRQDLYWDIKPGAGMVTGASLDTNSTTTDDDGYATNTVHGGSGKGSLKVTVSVPLPPGRTTPIAQDLVYTVNVTSKDDGELDVRVEYPHGAFFNDRFDDVKVYAFEHKNGQNTPCAGVDPNNISATGTAAWNLPIALPLPNTGVKVAYKDTTYTLVAIASKAFSGTAPVAVASACDEASAKIQGGATVRVTLQLTDLIFPYTGRYKAHTFIDFMSMLPGNPPDNCTFTSADAECKTVEGYVSMVGDFFTDPGHFAIVNLEDVIASQFGVNVPAGFTDVLANLVNAALEHYLPPWAKNIFTVGGDVSSMLRNLEVVEYYNFTENPTPSTSDAGLLVFPACADGQQDCKQYEEWTDICFDWRLGRCEGLDPDALNGCGRQCFPLNSFVAPRGGQPVAAVKGGFNASVRNLWDLSIEKHGLQLNYGAIILGVVEKLVLPAIDPNLRSVSDLVLSLLGGEDPDAHQPCMQMAGTAADNCCGSLAKRVFGQSGSSIWRDAAKSICVAGVPVLVDSLINYLVGNQADTASYLQIGTSDQFDVPAAEKKSCRLTFASNQDPQSPKIVLQKLGDLPDDKQCQLRAGLQIGDLAIDYAEAHFYADRDSDQ